MGLQTSQTWFTGAVTAGHVYVAVCWLRDISTTDGSAVTSAVIGVPPGWTLAYAGPSLPTGDPTRWAGVLVVLWRVGVAGMESSPSITFPSRVGSGWTVDAAYSRSICLVFSGMQGIPAVAVSSQQSQRLTYPAWSKSVTGHLVRVAAIMAGWTTTYKPAGTAVFDYVAPLSNHGGLGDTGWGMSVFDIAAAVPAAAQATKTTLVDGLALTVVVSDTDDPAAPSSVTATRVSDSQQNVAWTRNATTGAPYTNQYVERWDNVTNAYSQIASVSGSSTSYADTSTVPNRQYRYRVRASNSAGYSGYNYSPFIVTTPAPPTNLSAVKSGPDIVVSWTDASPFNDTFEIWDAPNNDAAQLAVIGTVADGTNSFTHVAPDPAKTHIYYAKAKTTSPALTSGFSTGSNLVQLQAPPNAPTNLSPNGTVRDAVDEIVTSWQHNPVDTTPQRQRQTRRRINGGAWVEASIVASATQSGSYSAGTFSNGSTLEWQVRTWGSATTGGADGTGASPWSASAVVVLSAKPTATINTPDGVSPVNTATLTVTWGYFDQEAKSQAEWKAVLYNAAGAAIESLSGSGTTTSATFATRLQDATNYSVGVKVRDADGVWSTEDLQAFSVAYAKPPVPQAWPEWDDTTGSVSVEALVAGAGAGEVEAVYLRVWRSVDGGTKWSLVADNILPGSTVVDPIPPLNSTVLYKAEAVSATPSISYSEAASVFTNSDRLKRVWLNTGPNFSVSVFLAPEAHIKTSGHRERQLRQFAGREWEVEYSSKARRKVIPVEGVIVRDTDDPALQTSSWNEIESAVLDYVAPACLRDLRGNRYFVSTNDPDWDGPHKQIQKVSFTATRVDYAEPETGGI